MMFKDGNWTIERNDEFINALTGGMLNATTALSDSFNSSSSDATDSTDPIDVTSKSTGMTVENTLSEIDSWVIGDIWNDGFCEISHYLYNGTSAIGGSLDIDFTIDQLAKSMDKKVGYDAYMAILPAEYADLVSFDSKLSEEIDTLYTTVKTADMTPKSGALDTEIFTQYQTAFSDACYEITGY